MASAARRIDYWRAKRFLYTTGGPIATVCVLLVTLCICISYTLPAWWQTPVGVFFALEAAMLIGCLWPRNAKILGTIMPNDGLSMWRTLTLKKSDIPAHFAANVQHLACTLIKEGKLAEAKEVVMSGIYRCSHRLIRGTAGFIACLRPTRSNPRRRNAKIF